MLSNSYLDLISKGVNAAVGGQSFDDAYLNKLIKQDDIILLNWDNMSNVLKSRVVSSLATKNAKFHDKIKEDILAEYISYRIEVILYLLRAGEEIDIIDLFKRTFSDLSRIEYVNHDSVAKFAEYVGIIDKDFILEYFLNRLRKDKKLSKMNRKYIYSFLIRSNNLNNPVVRKMRSDSSEEISLICLKEIFRHRANFEKFAFEEIISNFFDTKYASVAIFLAMNVDRDTLPYMINIDNHVAIKVIGGRMEYES